METAGSLIPLLCAALLLSYGDVDAVVDVIGITGRSVLLEVKPPLSENSAITWNFNTNVVAQNFPSLVCFEQFIGKCQLYVNGSLSIDSVSSANKGSYTLSVLAPGSTTSVTTDYRLRVYAPVSAATLSSNVSSAELWAEQDSVSLHCSAQGSAITFSWSLDGKPVSSKPPYYITESDSPPNSNLTINPVSRNDGGPFICTASNRLNSETSNETSFSINWRPDREMSCPVTSNGDILRLVCSWENGRPPANVTMTFNETTGMNLNIVTRNVSSKTLILGAVLNCSGDQLGKTSTCLRILEPPYSPGHDNNTIKDVTEGGSVTLTIHLTPRRTSRDAVSAEIVPATFTWYLDKMEIKSGVTSTNYSSNLHISEVTKANSGRYECTARNVIGSETFIFNVNVTAKAVPPTNGLNGGEIAGIVIGVLAGLTVIGIIVFFIVKKRSHSDDAAGTIYENADFTPDRTYETKLPGVMVNPATQRKEESNYQELIPHNEAVYHNVLPSPRR